MSLRLHGQKVEAVLFDLDGTLYRQRPLRLRMMRALLGLPFTTGSIGRSVRIVRALRVFRRTREELRELGQPAEPLDRLQYTEAADRVGESSEWLEETVGEWMYRRPLPFLRRHRRPGIAELLEFLAESGVPTGVFSDYPPVEKLAALELADHIRATWCATDPEINAFKPHPRGFLYAAEQWGLAPERVLYVGDRPEVDAEGASAAGMLSYIVEDQNRAGYAELKAALTR